MTFLAALRHDRVEAPWLIDGPIDGESFASTSTRCSSRPCTPATSSSWTTWARTGAAPSDAPSGRSAPSCFFLPKYSPDLNPIEMLFSKLKHSLRNAAKRTHDAVYQAIVELLPTVHPIECANYFAKAGYARIESHPALVTTHQNYR